MHFQAISTISIAFCLKFTEIRMTPVEFQIIILSFCMFNHYIFVQSKQKWQLDVITKDITKGLIFRVIW